MTTTMTPLLELDERRRASLGKIGRPQDFRYLVTEYPDGTVLLTPAVVISEAEARFLSDPALVATVEARRTQTSKRVRRAISS